MASTNCGVPPRAHGGKDVGQAVGVILGHAGRCLRRAFHFQRPADEEGLLDLLAVHPGGARRRLRHHIHQMLVDSRFTASRTGVRDTWSWAAMAFSSITSPGLMAPVRISRAPSDRSGRAGGATGPAVTVERSKDMLSY